MERVKNESKSKREREWRGQSKDEECEISLKKAQKEELLTERFEKRKRNQIRYNRNELQIEIEEEKI